MKVLMHYEDNEDDELHKTLKITLPKKWKTGPVSRLLQQFVESYNGNEMFGVPNPLEAEKMHLEIRKQQSFGAGHIRTETVGGKKKMQALASDEIVIDALTDYADVYVVHGAGQTKQDKQEEERIATVDEEAAKNTVQCTRFGCTRRFPKGGPYPPNCRYHASPPVFHETAKFWSCCPNKKAYDWETFQTIPGCQTAPSCTEEKQESNQKMFLGGTDLREQLTGGDSAKAQLKSIDDFNRAQAAGGSMAVPVLQRLQSVLEEVGVEKELYQQVVDAMQKDYKAAELSDLEVLEAVKQDLGKKLKSAFKSIAADQLRIK